MLSNFVALLCASLVLRAASSPSPGSDYQAPYERHDRDVIEGDYVVHFKPGHDLVQHQQRIGKNLSDSDIFQTMDFLPGYRATLDNHTVHELVRRDPGVKLVENNGRVHLIEPVEESMEDYGPEDKQDNNTSPLEKRFAQIQVAKAPFNLLMVAGGSKLNTPVQDGTYSMLKDAGKGVRVYILDTGITIGHKLFQGRAVNFKGDIFSRYLAGNQVMFDLDGHGTHVAGIVGALQYGVAQAATLVNVKVLGTQAQPGTSAQMAMAINDVTTEHNSLKKDKNFRGSVINMSLTSATLAAFEMAVDNAFNAGIPVIAAAGNGFNEPNRRPVLASTKSPCNFANTVCVGSVDKFYRKSSFSNFGPAVNINAPGTSIVSLSKKGGTYLTTKSGTSMATPHVAGMAAIWVGWERLLSDSSQVVARLRSNQLSGILGAVTSAQTPNLFATTGINLAGKTKFQPYVGAPTSRISARSADDAGLAAGDELFARAASGDAVSGDVASGSAGLIQSTSSAAGDEILAAAASGSAGPIQSTSSAAGDEILAAAVSGSAGLIQSTSSEIITFAETTLPGNPVVQYSLAASSDAPNFGNIVFETSFSLGSMSSAPLTLATPTSLSPASSFAAAGESAKSSFAAAGESAKSSFAAAGNSALSSFAAAGTSFAAAGDSAASSFAAGGESAASSFAAGGESSSALFR